MREASLALGATHWQTIYRVVIPYAGSGISAAVVLGIGRAIGETMAVLMVTGNAAVMPRSLFEPVRTIPATIAAELGEAPPAERTTSRSSCWGAFSSSSRWSSASRPK